MKIDYYCFVTDSLNSELDKAKRNRDSHIFDNLDFDMSTAKKIGKFTILDKESGLFYGADKKQISLAGKVVFPRCIIPDMNLLLNKLEEAQANSIINREDIQKIYSWPRYIQPLYRDVCVTTYGEFLKNFESYKQQYGKVFFKTQSKYINCEVLNVVNLQNLNFSAIETDNDLNGNSNTDKGLFSEPMYIVMSDKVKGFNDHRFNNLKKDDVVFVSPKLEVLHDKEYSHIPVEYRTFVVDDKFTISRSWVPNKPVPKAVENLVEQTIKALPKDWPKAYVLDILEFQDNGQKFYDICEFNPISCSGYEDGSTIFLQEDSLSKSEKSYHKNQQQELGEE